MRSRASRVTCSALSWIGIGAAAVLTFYSEQQIANRRSSIQTFDVRARETAEALGDVRAAQQAYVAAGQGLDFWIPKVDATMATIAETLTALRASAASPGAISALEEADVTFSELEKVDARARGYLESGAQLMAADVVFTEGGEAVTNAARQVERARVEERRAFDVFEAGRRRVEGLAIAGAGGLALLVIGALTPRGRTSASERPAASGPMPVSHSAVSTSGDLMLRQQERAEVPEQIAPLRSLDRSNQATASALRAAAQLCTDLGRVNDPEELNTLMGRAADVLDASGLVLWLATGSGVELRPAVAHGYSQEAMARMPPLARSANNAAAAAYRTGALQIVLSRPGSSKGAIVAPVLSVNGCIGVLSAEVRDGGETSYTIQALAAIFAAQLAGMLSTAPATGGEQRAASGGAI